jgi:hypothetical protein
MELMYRERHRRMGIKPLGLSAIEKLPHVHLIWKTPEPCTLGFMEALLQCQHPSYPPNHNECNHRSNWL